MRGAIPVEKDEDEDVLRSEDIEDKPLEVLFFKEGAFKVSIDLVLLLALSLLLPGTGRLGLFMMAAILRRSYRSGKAFE